MTEPPFDLVAFRRRVAGLYDLPPRLVFSQEELAPGNPDRDVEAVARASGYVKHATTFMGGSFRECICPKQPCGGVAEDDHRPVCPEHSREPAQVWHWASECPGR